MLERAASKVTHFIGFDRVGSLLLVYGGLVVVGLGVSAAVGPVRPAGVWSSLVLERPEKVEGEGATKYGN